MRFSVIVPVYGVEKYLDQCINSVLNQNFEDFELILVDDKSPDNCPAMCDSWARRDSRVRVIHKPKNEGLGFARNTGIEVACGEYILFLDSDDYISERTLDICNSVMTESTEVLVFGVEYFYQDKQGRTTLKEQAIPQSFIADTPEKRCELFAQLNQVGAFPFAWNKIYRRSFLTETGILFENTKLIEDFLFNIMLFGCAERVDSIDAVLYNYRKPAHETLVNKYSPEFFDLCKRKYRLEEAFLIGCNSLNQEHYDLIRLGYLKHLVSTVLKNRTRAAGLTFRQQKEKIKTIMDDSLTREVLSCLVTTDRKYRLLRDAFWEKKVILVMSYCFVIDFVQRYMLTLYRKLLKRK